MTLPTPYYVDDSIVLLHGDCLALLPLLAERGLPWFGDAQVDHLISDPPYEAEAHTKARRVARNPVEGGGIASDYEIDFAPVDEMTRTAVAQHAARLVRRWTLAFCQIEAVGEWKRCMVGAGLDWVRGQFWEKPDGAPQFTGDRPAQGGEAIATAHASGRKRWNGGGRRGMYRHPVNGGNHTQRSGSHPTEKPLPLMRELVSLFTDPGDLILDPFAGSGTTGLAARLEGRRAILIEREERYCEVAAKRLAHMPSEKANGQRSLFEAAE